jgi:L-fuculose-phosphate aldolase
MTARSTRRHLEDDLVDCCRRLMSYGWGTGCHNRLSVRLSEDRVLATSKEHLPIAREHLLVLNRDGQCVGGEGEPFFGIDLHMQIYQERPEIRAVVQAQPTVATGLSLGGAGLNPTYLVDAVLAFGNEIPTLPYATWSHYSDVLVHLLRSHDLVVLEHGGLLAVGEDLHTALSRLELAEHLAKVQLVAIQSGGGRRLKPEDISLLLSKPICTDFAKDFVDVRQLA